MTIRPMLNRRDAVILFFTTFVIGLMLLYKIAALQAMGVAIVGMAWALGHGCRLSTIANLNRRHKSVLLLAIFAAGLSLTSNLGLEFSSGVFVLGTALILALVPGLLIAIVTAVVTVKLSMPQFRSQKWWERKADAYSQIMEHLTLLEYSYGAYYEDATSIKVLSDERMETLAPDHRKAEESVRKAAAAGSYIVSKETAQVLNDFIKELDKPVGAENWVDEIGRHYSSTFTAIAKIRDFAKADLKQS